LTKISPNPATSFIMVTNNSNRDINITIYDGKGRIVMDELLSNERTELNVGRFPRGIYYFSLSMMGSTIDTGKLLLD